MYIHSSEASAVHTHDRIHIAFFPKKLQIFCEITMSIKLRVHIFKLTQLSFVLIFFLKSKHELIYLNQIKKNIIYNIVII